MAAVEEDSANTMAAGLAVGVVGQSTDGHGWAVEPSDQLTSPFVLLSQHVSAILGLQADLCCCHNMCLQSWW